MEQLLLQHARLGIAAVQQRDLLQSVAFPVQRFDFIHHPFGFFQIVERREKADFFACLRLCVQVFAQAVGVVGNHRIGRLQNRAHRTVILFQLNRRINAEFAHQTGHIAHVRTAETVNRLVVVAHGKHGRAVARHQFEPFVLQRVRILELVHQNMVETLLVMRAQRRVLPQHFIAAQHQFGKIHHAFAAAQFVVLRITFNQLFGVVVGRFQMLGAQAAFLLRVDKPLQHARRHGFFGNAQLFEQALHHRQLVGRIQNLEALRQLRVAVMQAQEAVAQAVERAQPHGAQRHGQHGAQPRLHFFGGLVGERYRQNIVHAGHAVLQQPGNAGRQNAGFAAARPR